MGSFGHGMGDSLRCGHMRLIRVPECLVPIYLPSTEYPVRAAILGSWVHGLKPTLGAYCRVD